MLSKRSKILRGNLKEVVSNMNNSEKSKNAKDQSVKLAVKPAFIPVKNKIQLMEKDQAKSKSESEEFIQKHKSIAQKLIENFEDEPKIVEEKVETEKSCNDEKDSNGHNEINDSLKNEKIQYEAPPKPLPRKSISDQGSSFEENSAPIPKPKPRLACSNFNYKVYFFYKFALNFLLFCFHLFE
jgi:hypothetical protein